MPAVAFFGPSAVVTPPRCSANIASKNTNKIVQEDKRVHGDMSFCAMAVP